MAYLPKNWTKNTYTNDVWFDLVTAKSIVNSIVFCNKGSTGNAVSVRLFDGTNELAVIVDAFQIDEEDSYTLDLRSLVVGSEQTLQCKASGDDMQFVASGVTY